MSSMRKITIELTENQFSFSRGKALELLNKNRNATVESIITNQVEKGLSGVNQHKVSKGKKVKIISKFL